MTRPQPAYVRFDASADDQLLITRICERYERMAAPLPRSYRRINLSMDLTACHLNGCPLRLQALLEADGFDFLHDLAGIARHISRETGQLQDHFLPRYWDRELVATTENAIAKARTPR